MLELKNIDVMIFNKYLIKNLTLTLNKGDKLAIIGEEGNGKSTLLKSILGICKYANITGTIEYGKNKIGYLEQSMDEKECNQKVYNFLFNSDNDYYEKINTLYTHLKTLQLDDSILEKSIHILSGGEKVKIRILKLLIEEYNILFLDEPTNDLDIETLEWLEKFINYTDKPIMYVSHDETLLSHTANIILHLEQIKNKTECRHTILKINYDTYVENRLHSILKTTQISKSEKRQFDKKQEKLRQLVQKVEYRQNTISRSDPHGAKVLKKKMHSLKSEEKRLDQMELTKKPDVEEAIYFSFEDVFIPNTKKILDLNIEEFVINEKLYRPIHLEVIGSEHLCIIGKNGSGKSTLIHKIYEQLKTREDIKIGYMPQNYEEIFENYQNVLAFLTPSKDQEEITKIRSYLGNMKFTKEEMTEKIENLSNGTKAKLFLMKFVIDRCNVLILDEPTRNVSPLSNPIIRKALKTFKGTIISVSHDRKYIEEVCNSTYILDESGLNKYIN